MRTSIRIFIIVALLTPIISLSNAVSAEIFPDRPIKIINWSTAGMADTITRILGKNVEKELGQPVIIENKPGAGGVIAVNYIVASKPDGYTIGMGVTSNFANKPHTSKLSYDILTSTTDILAVCKYNFGLAVKVDAPWNTFEEIIAYARNNPGKFSYAMSGIGGSPHIAMERIATQEKIKWTGIPFKSGGEAVIACLGGHAGAVIQGSIDVLPHVKAGKLKLLLSLDGDKWPDVPTVPTILEKGYNFTAMSYISYFGPKGIPEPVRKKLEDAFKKAMDDPSFDELMKKYHVQKTFMSGKDYAALWKPYYADMGKVIKALGLKGD